MTEAKKTTAARKPRVVKEEIAPEVEEVKAEADELAGKTVQQLRDLHALALEAESNAKREVHILRQRAANAVVDDDTQPELAVIKAKENVAEAGKWVRRIENALEDEFKDISGIHKF